MKHFLLILVVTFVFFGAVSVASADEFKPIVNIPTVDTGDNQTLPGYLNSLFTLAISIAAVLAVIMVVVGGLRYMSTDSVMGKHEGKDQITSAVLGLILLLTSWLILYVINPSILNLNALSSLQRLKDSGVINDTSSGERGVTEPAKDGTSTIPPRSQAPAEPVPCSVPNVLLVCYNPTVPDLFNFDRKPGAVCPPGQQPSRACQ